MVEGLNQPCRRHDKTSRTRHGTTGGAYSWCQAVAACNATVPFFMIRLNGPTNRGLNLAVPATASLKCQALKRTLSPTFRWLLSAFHQQFPSSSRQQTACNSLHEQSRHSSSPQRLWLLAKNSTHQWTLDCGDEHHNSERKVC